MRARQYLLAEIRDKDHEFLGTIHPVEAGCSLRMNVASTARLVVRNTHPLLPVLTNDGQEGLRAAVWLIRFDGATVLKHKLIEGQIGDLEGAGPRGDVTIPVIDDWEWFTQVLAYPNPTLPLSAQTAEYARYTGPSDTRALAAIAANVARLSLPWNVPPSEGLGQTGTTDLRVEPLSKVAEALTLDRLQLSLTRSAGNEWDVSISRGDEFSQPLTPQSGLLAQWQWKRQRSRHTRMAIGGRGSGADREFAQVIDADREARVGRVMEGFTAASGAAEGADLTPYGRDALAASAPKGGLVATLRESAWFRYPDAYRIGTKVKVQLGPVVVDDVITEITITQNRDGSFITVPKVGLADADPQVKLTKIIAGVADAVTGLERR